MKIFTSLFLILFSALSGLAQTEVEGKVVDENGDAVPFANIFFKNSHEGTISDEDGNFELKSDNDYDILKISFQGFETRKLPLKNEKKTDLKVVLKENVEELNSVNIYKGDTPKKNNPAIDILKKIWENRRDNGVSQYDQYQYQKYEKLQFDLGKIDSSLIHSKFFKGMEFIFEDVDTNGVSGESYLPIFINEAVSKVYGDNKMDKKKEELLGNRNSGFNENDAIISFIKDLYADYNIYDNFLNLFDKSFTSPLSKTGVSVYNYVLADSSFIEDKWSYNIVFYPRRKNELTFEGNFWVNDTTWAVNKINMEMSDGVNINWVNDVEISQDYDILNDSTFLITKDYFKAKFALRKRENARGVYGKRTTDYTDYKFNEEKPKDFYKEKRERRPEEIHNRSDEFWKENRTQKLSDNERGIYAMMDTLVKTPKFRRIYNVGEILTSGYINFGNFDYGPLLQSLAYNEVEGLRLRAGGRTYFGQNDMWRIEGYGAYGFKDHQFKYGIQGKWLLDSRTRLKLTAGHSRDVEQLGSSLTDTEDILGRGLGSSSLFSVGEVENLSSVNLSMFSLSIEPFKNLRFNAGINYRSIKSASHDFELDYYTDKEHSETSALTEQTEFTSSLRYSPGRETSGYGVERIPRNKSDHPEFFLKYTRGINGLTSHDFGFNELQFYYKHPFHIGGVGKLTARLEAGKTFDQVPPSLLNIVPANQTVFTRPGTFPLLRYYEFATDEYVSLHLQHNFGGRLFSRIPLLRDLNLREIVSMRGIIGDLSDKNRELNASTIDPVFMAPNDKPYWSWSVGIGNILKFFRVDFHFRGDYFNNPDARNFGVTGQFAVYF